MKVATRKGEYHGVKFNRVSEPFPSNEGRYNLIATVFNKNGAVSEPFPSNEGRYTIIDP
jgi:hypothetical protein